MITITAVIRARAGREAALRDTLADVARRAEREELGTLGSSISWGIEDRAVFTTYERFADEAANDAHNGSDAVARFFAQAGELIEGDAILHTCAELSATARTPSPSGIAACGRRCSRTAFPRPSSWERGHTPEAFHLRDCAGRPLLRHEPAGDADAARGARGRVPGPPRRPRRRPGAASRRACGTSASRRGSAIAPFRPTRRGTSAARTAPMRKEPTAALGVARARIHETWRPGLAPMAGERSPKRGARAPSHGRRRGGSAPPRPPSSEGAPRPPRRRRPDGPRRRPRRSPRGAARRAPRPPPGHRAPLGQRRNLAGDRLPGVGPRAGPLSSRATRAAARAVPGTAMPPRPVAWSATGS